jgi:uncharacterized protein (TIGR00369 family)
MANRLSKTIQSLEKYPSWLSGALRDFFIGRTVRFTGTSGIHYAKMTPEEVVVQLKNRKRVQNHIGQIHAAAMVLLAETATGMVLGMNIPDDKIPLAKSIQTQFVRRSTGAMQAVATLSPAQIEQIHQQEKGEVLVEVKVTDETGAEPVQCQIVWAWIPKQKKS